MELNQGRTILSKNIIPYLIKLASYHGTSSTGTVTEMIGLTEEIKGRKVI